MPLAGLRGAKLAPLWEETGPRPVFTGSPSKRRDGGHIANKKGRTPKPPSGLLDRPAYVLGFLALAAVLALDRDEVLPRRSPVGRFLPFLAPHLAPHR
jgi:hypothetical protein